MHANLFDQSRKRQEAPCDTVLVGFRTRACEGALPVATHSRWAGLVTRAGPAQLLRVTRPASARNLPHHRDQLRAWLVALHGEGWNQSRSFKSYRDSELILEFRKEFALSRWTPLMGYTRGGACGSRGADTVYSATTARMTTQWIAKGVHSQSAREGGGQTWEGETRECG